MPGHWQHPGHSGASTMIKQTKTTWHFKLRSAQIQLSRAENEQVTVSSQPSTPNSELTQVSRRLSGSDLCRVRVPFLPLQPGGSRRHRMHNCIHFFARD